MEKISIELNDYEIWTIKLALAYCKDRNTIKRNIQLKNSPKKFHKEIKEFWNTEKEKIENLEIMLMEKSKEITTHGKNITPKNK